MERFTEIFWTGSRSPNTSAFRALSRGQQTLFLCALALARRPRLLILDDPTLGLDPLVKRRLFDELIAQLVPSEGHPATSLLMTTHEVAGVETLATHAGVLANGRLLAAGPLEELKTRYVVLERSPDSAQGTEDEPFWRTTALGSSRFIERCDPEFEALIHSGATVRDLNLEELFVELCSQEGYNQDRKGPES